MIFHENGYDYLKKARKNDKIIPCNRDWYQKYEKKISRHTCYEFHGINLKTGQILLTGGGLKKTGLVGYYILERPLIQFDSDEFKKLKKVGLTITVELPLIPLEAVYKNGFDISQFDDATNPDYINLINDMLYPRY